jgi:hypothetical protein
MTAKSSIDRMANSWERLKTTSLGEKIAPPAIAVMDAISGSLDRGGAINAGLEKKGVKNWSLDRMAWQLSASEAEKDSMAWVGGYRTEEQRAAIAAYAAKGEWRAPGGSLATAAPPMPVVIAPPATINGAAVPLPLARPNETDMAIDAQDAARGYGMRSGGVASVPTLPDNLSVRPGQVVPEMQGLLAKIEAAGEQSGSDLAAGGGDAAEAIAKAAPEAGSGFGDAAAAKIHAEAASAGASFGDAAAARLRAALSGVFGGASAGQPAVSGNRGRTMPQAGQAGRAQ